MKRAGHASQLREAELLKTLTRATERERERERERAIGISATLANTRASCLGGAQGALSRESGIGCKTVARARGRADLKIWTTPRAHGDASQIASKI